MAEQSRLQVVPTNLRNAMALFGIVIDHLEWFGPTNDTNLGHRHESRTEMHASPDHMVEHAGNSKTSNEVHSLVWRLKY